MLAKMLLNYLAGKSTPKSVYTRAIILGILVAGFSCGAARPMNAAEPRSLPMIVSNVSDPQTPTGLTPFLECVNFSVPQNEITATFGYISANTSTVTIPFGPSNFFDPPPGFRGQPISFSPGVHHSVFSITFSLDISPTVTWHLLGQTVTASNDPALYCSSTSFTYQGRLTDGGKVASGPYDLLFELYDAPTDGDILDFIFQSGVNVTGGVFTVKLDFGTAVVPGSYLGIAAKHPGDSDFSYIRLSPRQPITAAPFAARSGLADSVVSVSGQSADNVSLATTMVLSGNVPGGGGNYIQNRTTQQTGSSFNVSGNGIAGGTLSGNNVGIGITTPNFKLHIVDTGLPSIRVDNSNPQGTWLQLNNTGTGGHNWGILSTGSGNGEGVGNLVITDGGGGHVVMNNPLQVPSCTGCTTVTSDRNAKSNFAAVNSRSVLERLVGIPIQSWNYNSDPKTIRHIGPMAQDFSAAFGLGTDDKHINLIDENGVALAAIQELYKNNQAKDQQINDLKNANADLTKRLEALEKVVEKLTKQNQ